jgi:uncharacterized protein YegP (UPF0339 family)
MVMIIISRTRQKKFYFTVQCPEKGTLLTGQHYTSKTACKKGIASLKNTVQGIGRYQWIEEKDETISFIIKSINGQKLGSSELYKSLHESAEVLSMLKGAIPEANIIDQTIRLRKQNA